MADFVPPTGIVVLSVLYSWARFENQRWIRARRGGMRGANAGLGAFVDMTGIIALVFSLAFLFAYGYDNGVAQAIGVAVVGVVGSIVFALIPFEAMVGGAAIWIAGTIGVWISGMLLAGQVSWFGAF